MENQEIKETIKRVKHEFMAYRNGIVSDTLRKAGMPYSVIFGLQLPQLTQIAKGIGKSEAIADYLWDDKGVRESRLLASYVYPEETISEEKAYVLATGIQTKEEADILCFRLLRRLPFASALALRLSAEVDPLPLYCAEALRRNLDSMQ